jgi:hypothetical protein
MGNCENQMQYDIPFLVYSGFFFLIYMVEIPNIILDEACSCVVSLQAYEPWTLSRINEIFSYIWHRKICETTRKVECTILSHIRKLN